MTTNTTQADNIWKLFNDTFEAEINAQEFAIDEAEWAGLLKALKIAEEATTPLLHSAVTQADRRTLETLAAILNGDDNQVETAKAYIWNKLKLTEGSDLVAVDFAYKQDPTYPQSELKKGTE